MRILLALILLLVTTLTGSAQGLWRNFFTVNANPIVDVVAGSNATVQATTPAVNIRRFTVNGVTDTNVVGLILTNTINGMLSTNVPAWAQNSTNATYVTTAILTNQLYGSNVVGSVPEATHSTNSDNAINATNLYNANLPIPTNSPAAGKVVTATSASSSEWKDPGILTTKAAFTTNYTVAATDAVLFCTGTNQLITLLDCTNSATPIGKMFTVIAASGTGSVIVTNANGVQKILNALSISVSSTNRLTVISDGSNWW